MKRKICVVITARPSYSRVKSVLSALRKKSNVQLQIVVAASALLEKYGNVSKAMYEDGFKIDAKVYNVLEGENLTSMAKTTGIGILEISTIFDNLKPDIVVTIADRYETMATAISSSYMNIPLGHIQGGEITGNIDEKVRHAITKLSDYHFAATKKAYERIIRMGELPESVFNTGCPSIDLIKMNQKSLEINFNPFEKYGGVGKLYTLENGYLVVMQHPVTTEYELSKSHIEETLKAIYELRIPTLWFWPNVDAGSDGTSKGIRSFRENHDTEFIHFFKNMHPLDFYKILKNSKCLIGNSSVGIRECSYLGVPVVNIGSRQDGREQGINVLNTGYDSNCIVNAIKKQLNNGHYSQDNLYGEGNAGMQIASILEKIDLKFHKKLLI